MLDIRYIRTHAKEVQENAKRKGYDVSIDELLKADESKRLLQQVADDLREKRNAIAASMKGAKPSAEVVAEGKAIKEQLVDVEANLKEADVKLTTLLFQVPNML